MCIAASASVVCSGSRRRLSQGIIILPNVIFYARAKSEAKQSREHSRLVKALSLVIKAKVYIKVQEKQRHIRRDDSETLRGRCP